MTTKSRLGKGLGALFPSLPGEPVSTKQTEKQSMERTQKPVKAISKDVPGSTKGEAKGDKKSDGNDAAKIGRAHV